MKKEAASGVRENYLPDGTDFTDIPKQSPRPDLLLTEECGKCKGHGYWNLITDAYGPGQHFKAFCSVCWGWGYRRQGETCIHEWGRGKNLGNCYNEWVCNLCGESRAVDSSD